MLEENKQRSIKNYLKKNRDEKQGRKKDPWSIKEIIWCKEKTRNWWEKVSTVGQSKPKTRKDLSLEQTFYVGCGESFNDDWVQCR